VFLCLAVAPQGVAAQSPFFGHRAAYAQSGLRRYDGFGRNPYDLVDGDYGYGGYGGYGGYYDPPPCPAYRPVEASEWHETSDGQLALRVALPGVRPGAHRLWLGDDGRTVQLRASRALPPRGRTCLPSGARLSADGTSEILEELVVIPAAGDATRATFRNLRGGLEVLVPRRPVLREGMVAAAKQPAPSPSRSASVGRPSKTPVPAPRPAPALPPLPPSDGVQVVDEAWPAPSKLEDASEGWWDNRGDFIPY